VFGNAKVSKIVHGIVFIIFDQIYVVGEHLLFRLFGCRQKAWYRWSRRVADRPFSCRHFLLIFGFMNISAIPDM
jgi:hypothetical protein